MGAPPHSSRRCLRFFWIISITCANARFQETTTSFKRDQRQAWRHRHRRGLRLRRLSLTLLYKLVLIDREHLVVGEQIKGEVVELIHVAAEEQRRCQHRPVGDVQDLFVLGEIRGSRMAAPAQHPNDEHVGIVEVPWAGEAGFVPVRKPDALQAGISGARGTGSPESSSMKHPPTR